MKTNSVVGAGIRLLLALVVMTASALRAPLSHAVNLEDAELAAADESATSDAVLGGANITPAVNLVFTGKTQTGGVATSTGAYVTISATAMTFYNPFATADTTVGTAGVVTYASTLGSDTMGGLCDYLHSLGAKYKCVLRGAKRDDPPKILQTQTATNATNNLGADGGFSVMQTTTTFVSLGIVPAAGRRVVLKQCVSNGNMSPGDNGLQIYGQLRKYGAVASAQAKDPWGTTADDTYRVWRSSQVAATDTTQPSSNALPRWIEFAKDAHVVVRQGNTESTSVQTSANFVRCSWDER